MTGCVTHEGKFTALTWRSTIPPYYTYFVNCESQKAGCSTIFGMLQQGKRSAITILSSEISSSAACTPALFQTTCPSNATKSDCIVVWELEGIVITCPSQDRRRGLYSIDVRSSITWSKSCKSAALHRARKFFKVLISFARRSFWVHHYFA